MNLCIDVGNSQMHGGVYDETGELVTQFRKESSLRVSGDELGLFLVSALKARDIAPGSIERIGISCVVPDEVFALREACRNYFHRDPLFLEAGIKTRLKIKTRNPLEVGADRIANAIAAADLYPGQDVVVIDFGTAITLDAVSARREYLGGSIAAGLGLAMESLGSKTAKLPFVEITRAPGALGRSTIESIQGGLYYGYLGLIRELTKRIQEEAFEGGPCRLVATGGYSRLYRDAGVFDEIIPDLVLRGIVALLQMNPESSPSTAKIS